MTRISISKCDTYSFIIPKKKPTWLFGLGLFVSLCISLNALQLHAQNEGYEIKLDISNYYGDTIYLANFLMDKQYFVDTAFGENGQFTLAGEEELPGGVYLLVFPGYSKFSQFLLPTAEQHFSVKLNYKDLRKEVQYKGSRDNQLFQEYMSFLDEQGKKALPIREKVMAARKNNEDTKAYEKEMQQLTNEVRAYQKNVVKKHPNTLSALLIKSAMDVELPSFEGTPEEVNEKKYYYLRQHYFDNLELANPTLLRTPLLFKKLDDYLKHYTPQHPDSIILSLDRILEGMKPAEETFKYYLVHWLNKYAASKFVGMDAVYVHLVDTYYATGLAPWTEEEQLGKIIKNADELRSILIGKTAPELELFELDIPGTIARKTNEEPLTRVSTGSVRPLSEINARYTILIFWEPTCGHCKKEMPKLGELYKKVRDKGIEVYAVCGKTVQDDGMVLCAEFLQDKELMDWINVVDPYYRTRYKTTYNVKTTPQVFVLNENKEIISKRIGIDQVEELLERLLKEDKEVGDKR